MDPGAATRAVRRWKIATAGAAVVGLVATGAVYVVMDQRADELQADLDAAEEQTEQSDDDDSGGLLDGLDDVDPILFECLGGGGLPGERSIPEGDVETQVAAIQRIVTTERGLDVDGEVEIDFVSLDEVRRRAVDITSEELDAEQAAVDARLLAALGAVEPGTDLVETQLAALDAGVGGFYDPDTEQLVIGSEEMDGLGTFITAHELVHAAVDAAVGLPDQEAVASSAGSDAAYAALSAIEGDASLYSQQFVAEHLPIAELLSLQAKSIATGTDLAGLPHFVSRQLEFPYLEGMTFTCDVFLDGGWPAVDGTYTNLPSTTAQILFPDRYQAGEKAQDVRDPAGPTPGWSRLHSDTFGAADLMFLLEAPGDDEDAALSGIEERVAAWAGGEFTVWGRGEDTAVALVLADRGDAVPMCETVADFYAAAFPDANRSAEADTTFTGDDQTAVVSCAGDEVALGIGPDLETARSAVA